MLNDEILMIIILLEMLQILLLYDFCQFVFIILKILRRLLCQIFDESLKVMIMCGRELTIKS